MKTRIANLWEVPQADARVITTNGFVKKDGSAVMGRGCAAEAKRKYPGIDKWLGLNLREGGNHVHTLLQNAGRNNDEWIISFPVKHNWWEKADIELIKRSADELVELTNKLKLKRVVMPRPGCGNGQLEWSYVRVVIREILDDRFIVVHYG